MVVTSSELGLKTSEMFPLLIAQSVLLVWVSVTAAGARFAASAEAAATKRPKRPKQQDLPTENLLTLNPPRLPATLLSLGRIAPAIGANLNRNQANRGRVAAPENVLCTQGWATTARKIQEICGQLNNYHQLPQ
jgi:hypothetical protein